MSRGLNSIVTTLAELRFEIQSLNMERLREPRFAEAWTPLSDVGQRHAWISNAFREAVFDLDHALVDSEFRPAPLDELPDGEFWSIGAYVSSEPARPMFKGFLEPVRRLPVVGALPDLVVSYLITLPDLDLLDREHHGHIKWHYHYLTEKKKRTNVVLCWDTRAKPPQPEDKKWVRSLFQETHGEGHVTSWARPDLWSGEKKLSMHQACSPDLVEWPLSEFRCASNKAGPVWPESALLTPHPSSASHSKTRR